MNQNFEHFYIKWYQRSLYFCLQYVANEEDAKNIVHDVFLHLYEQRQSFEQQQNQVSYLLTSIKHHALDFLRAELRKTDVVREVKCEIELRLSYDALNTLDIEQFDDAKLKQRIREAVDTLPKRCREIFVMKKLQGLTHKEIAQILGISVKTIDAQMAIAYRKLRQELKDCISSTWIILLLINLYR